MSDEFLIWVMRAYLAFQSEIGFGFTTLEYSDLMKSWLIRWAGDFGGVTYRYGKPLSEFLESERIAPDAIGREIAREAKEHIRAQEELKRLMEV